MKTRSSARLAVLAAAAATAAALAPPSAAAPAPDGKVDFTYSPPELSQTGDQVIWRWALRNTGDRPVSGVLLFHRIKPNLKIVSISAPCKVTRRTVRCDYRTLNPRQKKQGTLTADLPDDVTGLVQIRGRVTWQLPATAPTPPERPSTGALPPERDESPQPRPNITVKRSALITPWYATTS
ncbi:hypothetical protein [Actinomadura rugatobispora]|uniref:DUF11 domain-containing protein n=1 Tax=Actinomadura rugatobispora TaxID=1994 RepID=A0ABW0ZY29_9ACTN|nr:hypothetical protein GCM10010200_016410 [Actinomadura rugatobispora]